MGGLVSSEKHLIATEDLPLTTTTFNFKAEIIYCSRFIRHYSFQKRSNDTMILDRKGSNVDLCVAFGGSNSLHPNDICFDPGAKPWIAEVVRGPAPAPSTAPIKYFPN